MDNTYYNFSAITVEGNRSVEVDQYCNAVAFLNIGTSIVTVNGIPLNPGVPGTNNGESYSIPGNRGEYFRGRIDVLFNGNAGRLLVIQKTYIELQ